VGIDLEKLKQKTEIRSVIANYFSKEEQSFIYGSEAEISDRFFLLWTRKEALLKRIGTGIINDLNQISVSGPVNILKKDPFNNLAHESVLDVYYLYSLKLKDYYLSIAIHGGVQ